MGKLQDDYTALKTMVDGAAEEVTKADGGNKAAGTRVRKIMQETKEQAQVIRVAALGASKEGGE